MAEKKTVLAKGPFYVYDASIRETVNSANTLAQAKDYIREEIKDSRDGRDFVVLGVVSTVESVLEMVFKDVEDTAPAKKKEKSPISYRW